MTRTRNKMSFICLGLLIIFWVNPAFSKKSTNQTVEIESVTVTVTADKREQNIQQVPSTITAFTENQIDDLSITDVSGVIDQIPNMTYFPSFMNGSNHTNFRGLNTGMFTGKNPVVIFVDDIPQDHYSNYTSDLYNIKRIEVLRGSQGTLYGKNAIGGVINIISKEPGNSFESRLTTEAAEDGTFRLSGYSNGPLIKDKFFYGLSANYYRTEGFMDNDYPGEDKFDDEESFSLKARLRFVPSDRLNINFHAGVSGRDDGSGVQMNGTDDVEYHAYKSPDDYSKPRNYNSALKLEYSGNVTDLVSITTYDYHKMDVEMDQIYLGHGNTYKRMSESDNNSYSQELRLKSKDDKTGLKWIGGLYFSREDNSYDKNGMAYYNVGPDEIGYNWPDDLEEQTIAGFGQITVPMASAFEFTTGLRYERIDKELDYRYRVVNPDTGELLQADPFNPSGPVSAGYNISDDWDNWLPKGAFSWFVNNDVMLYTSVAKGYLAGGFNLSENNKDKATFNEQTSYNYEFGAKTSWLNNRLMVNANVFYMDIDDIQVAYMDAQRNVYASNAGKAHSKGVELEIKAKPLKGLDLNASFGLIEAEYDEYTNMSGIDCEGKKIEKTPDYSFNLSAQYRHLTGIYIRGEVQGYGKSYFDDINSEGQDEYQLVNMKIGHETENWDFYLYGNNLFDKEYYSSGHMASGSIVSIVGEPQRFGFIVSLRF